MHRDEPIEARVWDSERRSSPFSTVSDPYNDDDFCETCENSYDETGACKCGADVVAVDVATGAAVYVIHNGRTVQLFGDVVA